MIKQYITQSFYIEVHPDSPNKDTRVVLASDVQELELSYQTLICATRQALERLTQTDLSVEGLLNAKLAVQTILNNGLNGLVFPQHKPVNYQPGSDVFIEYIQTKEKE